MLTYKITEWTGYPGWSYRKNVEYIKARTPQQAFKRYRGKHPHAPPDQLTCSRPLTAAEKIRNMLH